MLYRGTTCEIKIQIQQRKQCNSGKTRALETDSTHGRSKHEDWILYPASRRTHQHLEDYYGAVNGIRIVAIPS